MLGRDGALVSQYPPFWLNIGYLPRDGLGKDRGGCLEGATSLYSEGTK